MRLPTRILEVPSLDVFDKKAYIAFNVYRPEIIIPDGPANVLVCWPGGSYSKSYWDVAPNSYSFANYMTEKGFVVIVLDPLGVGESFKPTNGDTLSLTVLASAAADVVSQIRVLIGSGQLDPDLPPLLSAQYTGIGHSMGGCLATVEQSLFKSYDTLAVLGFPHLTYDLNITKGGGYGHRDISFIDHSQPHEMAAADLVRNMHTESWDDVYVRSNRSKMHALFHAPDVASDVIAADDAAAVAWPRRPIVEALTAGRTRPYARSLTCPIFVAFGDIDGTSEPHSEVTCYSASRDVTLHVLQGSGHCYNFATNRKTQWSILAQWITSVSSRE